MRAKSQLTCKNKTNMQKHNYEGKNKAKKGKTQLREEKVQLKTQKQK